MCIYIYIYIIRTYKPHIKYHKNEKVSLYASKTYIFTICEMID